MTSGSEQIVPEAGLTARQLQMFKMFVATVGSGLTPEEYAAHLGENQDRAVIFAVSPEAALAAEAARQALLHSDDVEPVPTPEQYRYAGIASAEAMRAYIDQAFQRVDEANQVSRDNEEASRRDDLTSRTVDAHRANEAILSRIYEDRLRRSRIFGEALRDPHFTEPTNLEHAMAQSLEQAWSEIDARRAQTLADGRQWSVADEVWERAHLAEARQRGDADALFRQVEQELPDAIGYVSRTAEHLAEADPAPTREPWNPAELEAIGGRLADARARAALDAERAVAIGEARRLEHTQQVLKAQEAMVTEALKNQRALAAAADLGDRDAYLVAATNAETPAATEYVRQRLAAQSGRMPPGPEVPYTPDETFIGRELAAAKTYWEMMRADAATAGRPPPAPEALAAVAQALDGLVDSVAAARQQQQQIVAAMQLAKGPVAQGPVAQGPGSRMAGPELAEGVTDPGDPAGRVGPRDGRNQPGKQKGPGGEEGPGVGESGPGDGPEGPHGPGGGGGGTPRPTQPLHGPGGGDQPLEPDPSYVAVRQSVVSDPGGTSSALGPAGTQANLPADRMTGRHQRRSRPALSATSVGGSAARRARQLLRRAVTTGPGSAGTTTSSTIATSSTIGATATSSTPTRTTPTIAEPNGRSASPTGRDSRGTMTGRVTAGRNAESGGRPSGHGTAVSRPTLTRGGVPGTSGPASPGA